MSNGHFTLLSDRTVLALSGTEVRDFLQGLVTSDVDKLTPEHATYAGLLTPQGKILFDFFLVQHGEAIWLDCAAGMAADLKKRLTFYKLRAAVEIEDMSGTLGVAALWGADKPFGLEEAGAATTLVGGVAFTDPRFGKAGARVIAPADALAALLSEQGCEAASQDDYHAHRIALGLADSVHDIGSGEHFPHECNFDQIGGVDFKKGCYVGQEVVSRTEHRSNARKRLVPMAFDNAAPETGTDISGNGKSVGQITSSAGRHALGLIRLDRAQSALDAEGGLSAGEQPVALRKPEWARFDVPGAA